MTCEQCKKQLNEGKRFCSKECYRLFRSHKGFLISNRYTFPKGHIFRRSWTDEQRKQISEYSKVGIVGMKGKKHKKETLEKMRLKANGRKHTFETRKKISIIQLKIKKQFREENWQNFVTPKDKLERHRFRDEIQKQVFKRDNYTCQDFGEVGGYLQAHHIKSFSKYPELRLEILNGITLCVPCHKLTDNYGFGAWRNINCAVAQEA